jgi:hypothetical protein
MVNGVDTHGELENFGHEYWPLPFSFLISAVILDCLYTFAQVTLQFGKSFGHYERCLLLGDFSLSMHLNCLKFSSECSPHSYIDTFVLGNEMPRTNIDIFLIYIKLYVWK